MPQKPQKYLLDSIEADKHNLQQMMNRLPKSESKGEYRGTAAAMKILVKEIHNQRVLLEDKIWHSEETVRIPLFVVEPTPLEGLEAFKAMDSFFGNIKD